MAITIIPSASGQRHQPARDAHRHQAPPARCPRPAAGASGYARRRDRGCSCGRGRAHDRGYVLWSHRGDPAAAEGRHRCQISRAPKTTTSRPERISRIGTSTPGTKNRPGEQRQQADHDHRRGMGEGHDRAERDGVALRRRGCPPGGGDQRLAVAGASARAARRAPRPAPAPAAAPRRERWRIQVIQQLPRRPRSARCEPSSSPAGWSLVAAACRRWLSPWSCLC